MNIWIITLVPNYLSIEGIGWLTIERQQHKPLPKMKIPTNLFLLMSWTTN